MLVKEKMTSRKGVLFRSPDTRTCSAHLAISLQVEKGLDVTMFTTKRYCTATICYYHFNVDDEREKTEDYMQNIESGDGRRARIHR